jgi:hypothetical protein
VIAIVNQRLWVCYIGNEEFVVAYDLTSETFILGELVTVFRTSFLKGRIVSSLECNYWENEVWT